MARAPNNFSYQSPVASIGDSLARAIFGDPAAAQAQAAAQQQEDLRAAQAERERAAAGYDTARTTGVNTANAAQSGLPGLVEAWARAQQPAPPPPTVDSPEFGNFDQPLNIPAAPDKMGALAALIGSMGQMQGDKINPSEIMGTTASFAGGDELARRGMVAQGHSPTAAFAITPERADEIAGIGNAADLAQALGVAQINNRDDVQVARIGADARRDVALTNNRDDIPVAQIGAAGRGGTAPGFDAIQRAIPGATMNSGLRTPDRNRSVGGVSNSTHLGQTPGVQGYDIPPQPGMTVQEAARRIEAANPGVRVIEAINEGDHFHFALQAAPTSGRAGAPAKPAAPKPPKPITPALNDALVAELGKQIPGFTEGGPAAQAYLTGLATEIFQRTGNIAGSVQQAIAENRRRAQRTRAAPTGPAAPANGQSNFPAPRMGAMSVASERSEAMAAIAKGAPRAVVAARFKQKTGQAL